MRIWLVLFTIPVALLIGVSLAGCHRPAPAQPSAGMPAAPAAPPVHVAAGGGGATVRVWAEPTLALALDALKPELEKRGAIKLSIEYHDSTELARQPAQARQPGPADVYIYPDAGIFAKLAAAKAIDEVTQRTCAGDRLVVACRQGEHWVMATLFDIYRLRFKWIGLAPKDSALGQFSQQALASDGALPRVQKRVKYLASADELPKALKRDETQLVMTYASVVSLDRSLGVAVLVDPGLHEDIRYKAAAAVGKGAQPGVMELLRLLAEDSEMQQRWASYGFVDRATAMVEIR
jgi:ABC-type molybdate transport system substrate-binding protein